MKKFVQNVTISTTWEQIKKKGGGGNFQNFLLKKGIRLLSSKMKSPAIAILQCSGSASVESSPAACRNNVYLSFITDSLPIAIRDKNLSSPMHQL